MRRGLSLVRALGALVVMVALVAGVPALLIATVGNPLPTALPSVDDVRVTLTQNGDGFARFVIAALATIIWFVWAQLVVAIGFEIVAALRQRETRSLPTAPGVQAFAARLVASLTLASTLVAGPAIAPAIGTLTFDGLEPVAALVLEDAAIVPDPVGRSSSEATDWQAGQAHELAPPAQVVGSRMTITLRGDTELWDLAEAAYGDGVEWKSIAALNAGARDAAGDMITTDTEVLPGGTVVALPGVVDEAGVELHGSVAVLGGPVEVSVAAAAAATHVPVGTRIETAVGPHTVAQGQVVDPSVHVVEPGDSMWSVAEREVERRIGHQPTDSEIAAYWVDVVRSNSDVPSGDVNLIHPGDELVMPGTAGPDVEVVDSPPEGSRAAAASADELPAETEDPATAALADLADLAGVVDGPVDHSHASPGRDTGARQAPSIASNTGSIDSSGEVAADASADADVAVEGESGADGERGFLLPQLTMAALGSAMLAGGVVGALRRRRGLQRRMRQPATMAPRPSSEAAAFEAALAHAADCVVRSDQGSGWRMVPAAAVAALRAAGPMELRADQSGRLCAVPLRTTDDTVTDAGDSPGERGAGRVEIPLVDDLSAADVADRLGSDLPHADVVPGPGEATVPTSLIVGTDPVSGTAVMLDLASSTCVDLRGDRADLGRFARGAVLDLAVSDRADDLCVIAVDVAPELADLERVRCVATMAEALAVAVRCGHATPDSATPVIVIVADDVTDDEHAMGALVEIGASILAPGQPHAATRITVSGNQARLWPGGTTVQLAAPDNAGYRSVAELVRTTSLDQESAAPPAPIEEVLDITDARTCLVEPGPVEVKVLGPVEIHGADAFSSVKAVDVITYLAFHRHGVDADQIKSWVWPPFEPPTDKALANVLSRARTALGTDDDGTPLLSRAGSDRTYRLADVVTTDFDRFRAHVEMAEAAAGRDDRQAELGAMVAALELIRGVPFTGGAASSFAWADNHVRAHIEFTIDEAVHRCADLALELGDLAAARHAVFKGLELVPGCEQCYRRRFLVARADNNRTELRRAMADLERTTMADLGEPEAVDMISAELLALYHELDNDLLARTT